MRQSDWKTRLIGYLGIVAQQPFEPGVSDCALFAAGAVQAMTGVDLAADWRGRYATLADGLALLQSRGFADHIALAAGHFAEIPPALAAAGDLAVVQGLEGEALGVVQGEGLYVLTPTRLGILPLTHAIRAFRVT